MTNASASSAPQPSPSGTAGTVVGRGELETFLKPRGLDAEIALKYGLSACNSRVEFSYKRDGAEIYKKYRTFDKVFSCDPGHEPFFWNIDALFDESLENEPLIITEGELDALAAIQCGFPRAISVPNGASVSGEHIMPRYLEEVADRLRSINEIILSVDGDEKGQALAVRLADYIGKQRCKNLKYPKGCKDLNDALREFGQRGVKEAIKRAEWIEDDEVFDFVDLRPIPYQRPYDIGIPGFEKHLNIRLGDFSVWTGIPGSGKTTFLNDVTCRLAERHRLKIAIASFEQHPTQDHRRNLRTWRMKKLEKDMTAEEKVKADEWINENFCFIVPKDDTDVTLDWFMDRAAAAVIRKKAKFVILDPWNECDHHRPNGMTLTEYTGHAIKKFKKFARKYNVHVAVVAHPAKLQRRRDDGKYPVPSLYDISDSAHWFNKPDLGVVVHREPGEGDFVQIAKSHYHTEIGVPAVVDVRFNIETGRYMVVDNLVIQGQKGAKQ